MDSSCQLSDMARIELRLMHLCNKYKLELSKGIYRSYRVSSKFESFEFDVDGRKVRQIWHFPKLQYSRFIRKGLFHKQLKGSKSLSVDEAMYYIYKHTRNKFYAREWSYRKVFTS